jgi:hypothetical protein
MDPNDWLEIIRREYLEDFIPAGGAAIKCIVPADAAGRRNVQQSLGQAAEALGYTFAAVDAETTKLHLIDRLFHAVARQIDWDALTRAYLARSLTEIGYRLPETQRTPDWPATSTAAEDGDADALTVDRLAAANDAPAPMLLAEIRRGLWHRLLRDYALAREFRLAMLRLCLSHLDPTDEPLLADAVKQWLWGDLRLISALKPALIFQRVARHNARHMLFSLAHWLVLAGRRGLVLFLDIARYADTTRPAERGPGFYYSTAACMDLYEVLRQLIDATDELEHCFAGVVAAPEFLSDDRRGLRSYQALYMRIADEVRDRYRPNPRSSLVRLADVQSNGVAGSIAAGPLTPAAAGAAP